MGKLKDNIFLRIKLVKLIVTVSWFWRIILGLKTVHSTGNIYSSKNNYFFCICESLQIPLTFHNKAIAARDAHFLNF